MTNEPTNDAALTIILTLLPVTETQGSDVPATKGVPVALGIDIPADLVASDDVQAVALHVSTEAARLLDENKDSLVTWIASNYILQLATFRGTVLGKNVPNRKARRAAGERAEK